MKILGINYDMYLTSAAMIVDGKITAAVAEERITRAKLSREFPSNAIRYCLEESNCRIEDLDYIVNGFNPGVFLEKFHPLFSRQRRVWGELTYSILDQLSSFFENREGSEIEYLEQYLKLGNGGCRTIYINHHMAHAANAFFLSPFDEAAILTVDGRGERETAMFAIGRGNKIEKIDSMSLPHSLGSFYSTFTEFLGFKPESDEWKVMALAAYEDSNNEYLGKVLDTLQFLPNGTIELDTSYYTQFFQEFGRFYSPKFVAKFGEPRQRDQEIQRRHKKIAAAMQRVMEMALVHMLSSLYEKTGLKNVAVSGGVFMNSVFNGKILRDTAFEKVFISSCPDDSGNSLGAALYVYNCLLGNQYREEQTHNFYGPEFSSEEILKTLRNFGVKAEKVSDLENYIAAELSKGKLVGWFQGRMEFGQRALGNRSILADPRDPNMKDKINLAVKYRESFRPFAPSILEEHVEEYFNIDPGVKVPFMEMVYMIKESKRSQIPAVVHIDGSARLQIVTKQTNQRFYKLIKAFQQSTELPILLNTSFNLNGEPIVCTPTDAIRTFYSCGLDILAIGDYVVTKGEVRS